MWFLIKGTFWFSMVLVMLPFLDPQSGPVLEKGPNVDVGDTVFAATEAFGYMRAICLEKPDVCEKGGETFVALGHRAREGARIAYQFLGERFAEEGIPANTGAIPSVEPVAGDAAADLAAADPQPLPLKAPVPRPRP